MLEEAYVDYITPEKLSSIEIGYKGIIGDVLLVDMNYYNNNYTDFEGGQNVNAKFVSTHKGQAIPAGYTWALNSNTDADVRSWGFGLGMTVDVGLGYKLTGNYNYKNLEIDGSVLQKVILSLILIHQRICTLSLFQIEKYSKLWILSKSKIPG